MASVAPLPLTPEAYLALDRAAEQRSEFLDGAMLPMTGASFEHVMIVANLSGELYNLLRGGPYRALTNDLRVAIGHGNYVYPDVLVICGRPQFADDQFDTVLNPQVIFEVLSPSTERRDRGAKWQHYQGIPSLRQYVLIAPDAPALEWYDRQADNSWRRTEVAGWEGALHLESLGVEVPVRAIYRDVG